MWETVNTVANRPPIETLTSCAFTGNFHALLLFRNEQELDLVSQAVHRLVHRAIELDGTCEPSNILTFCTLLKYALTGTGEHGVGVGKKEYLTEELGPGTVMIMKTIKKAIDPYNLFNPGKVRLLRHDIEDT
jgi:D-lactate dehydrogenase (cytochrome)